MAWLGSLQVNITPMQDLHISDVQFDEYYLNITAKNLCIQAKIVSEVTVRNIEAYGYGFSVDWTFKPHTVAVHEPLPLGEEISFCISFSWTSGCVYQIELETADKGWGTALNVVAP
jgi:hypothetical protein